VRQVLAVTNTSGPMSRLMPRTMSTHLRVEVVHGARELRSDAHSPFWLCSASSAGTHTSGPVPVTINELMNEIDYFRVRTNCTPVSLRIPTPADAKLAPTSSHQKMYVP
jgi:hypothetical protein